MTQAALLEQVTHTIIKRFHPKRIVLFGSHARGDADSGSDLDLFIEMPTSQRPPERAIEGRACQYITFAISRPDLAQIWTERLRKNRDIAWTLLRFSLLKRVQRWPEDGMRDGKGIF